MNPFESIDRVLFSDDRAIRFYRDLAANLSWGRSMQVLDDLQHFREAAAEGRARSMSSPGAALLMVALMHVEWGAPLYFNDQLFDAWAQSPAGAYVECVQDGYRLPAGFPHCPCGAVTGQPGSWARLAGASVTIPLQ